MVSESPVMELADLLSAQDRISKDIRLTPLLRKPTLDNYVSHPVYIKCEHLQRTGSFKLRGALNLIGQLTSEERRHGVVAASAGNHAQGVSVAAAELGVSAKIFMPYDASLAKVEATKNYGASVVLDGQNLTEALAKAYTYSEDSGAIFVHPFDDAHIVAGQGTLGLEIIEQLPDVQTVVIPVGGGGLAAGVTLAIRALRPACRIVAVQTSAFPSLRLSIDAGQPITVPTAPTIADGIAVKQLGQLPFSILRDNVDQIVEVTEEELSTAILWSMERAKQVLEGAGAAALAAVLAGKVKASGPVCVVVAGGNIDPANLVSVIRHGLTAVGRFLYLGTIVPDRPGELSKLLALLAKTGVNILSVEHHREGIHLRVGETRVDLTLQTRNTEHVSDVIRALTDSNYPIIH